MNVQVLVDSIVRQVTVLIAQLATAGGVRGLNHPLAAEVKGQLKAYARASGGCASASTRTTPPRACLRNTNRSWPTWVNASWRGNDIMDPKMTKAEPATVTRRPKTILQSAVWLLLGAALAGIAAACGASAASNSALAGDSDFLRRCNPADARLTSCSPDLECIAGVCTRTCDADLGNACSNLAPAAECNASAGAGVCELTCTEGADCAALGSDYDCDAGYCRAPAGRLASDGTPIETNGPIDCNVYRNQPGTPLQVALRNDTGAPIYVQPYRECNDSRSSVVELSRADELVNIRGFECGVRSCQDIQDNGVQEPGPCLAACAPIPELIRLEPGAELSAGQTWLEYASHGLTPSSFLMHESCTGGDAQACYAEVDLFPAPYSFTARAFTDLDCPEGQTCNCTPGDSGTCTTSVQGGAGQTLSASAGVTLGEPSASLPIPSVVLRFAATLF